MFLSARYRPNIWPFWGLIAFEFGLTVALLALVGIAAPDLYRTRLWADGAENFFNSSPKAGMYAAANYRPYTTPMVWSQFITNYNLVVVVLSMFLMLVKSILYMLHVFPPIISAILHVVLSGLFAVSVYFQASSDTSDPRNPQNGPPWYITKSCSVARYQSNIGYCQQAKATFACFVVMLCVFLAYSGFSIFSCIPSKAHQAEYAEKQRLKKEKYSALYSPEELEPPKTARSAAYTIPETPGIENLNPVTPRTFAFHKLSGTAKNKTLRLQIGKKSAGPSLPQDQNSRPEYPMRSPGFPQTGFSQHQNQAEMGGVVGSSSSNNKAEPMYFPPPPKQANR